MPDDRSYATESAHSPTILETQLDSIALQLCRMKARVVKQDVLDHLTQSEREKLDAALSRAEQNLYRLTATLRGE